ncbi:zinc finger and BTB domain-containing protein 45-like isoform X13 [Zerene cesonia]|uniref:zinc finger and BTB domain-containing protein 45-like isoform X13 n=1 Tax=Zerene cesonia TaxID=33412 RepID=UPI0018E4E7BC|nr:zinc finger and BTB domain-containing protein 45-like isoform X13 [Zerene cesonia]
MFFTARKAGAARLASWRGVFARRARPPLPARRRCKFSTKKLVVSRPRLEEVTFPRALNRLFRRYSGGKLEFMLKYFNENISLALQERYRDLHEYRKEVEDSPREAKVPKIAEEGESVGGEGAFESSAAPPFPRLLEQPKEEDNFVASWLQNSFKMTAAEGNEAAAGGSALDLRAAPLSLHIPAIQAEAQRFKMQDFWNRSRPPSPVQEDQPGPAPPTPQPPPTPDHKIMAEKLVSEIQQQQSPSADSTMSERSLVPFALVNLLSSLNNVDQQARSGQSISERTLEECWSTLQRVSWHLFQCIFMHKNAMQMHARELQRGLGGEVKPHQCQQCLKSFSSNHQLVQHIRVHTGEKPYKCSYCDRRFKQLSHVQQHTRLHTGQFIGLKLEYVHARRRLVVE